MRRKTFKGYRNKLKNSFATRLRASWQSFRRTRVHHQAKVLHLGGRARVHARKCRARIVPTSCRRRCCRLPDLAVGARTHGSEQLVSLRYLPFRSVDLDLVKLRHASPARVALGHGSGFTVTGVPSHSRSPTRSLPCATPHPQVAATRTSRYRQVRATRAGQRAHP